MPDVRLVGLHGFTQTGAHWQPVLTAASRRLAAAGIDAECVHPDLPGHGTASDRPCEFDEAMTALLADVPTRAYPTVWAGYSMGGRHLLHLATRHPERVDGCVLVSTTAGIDDAAARAERRRSDAARADEVEQLGVERFIAQWTAMPLFATMPASDHDLAERHRNTASGLAASLRSAGTGAQEPLWDLLHVVDVPTVVLTGDLDTKFTLLGERLARSLPVAEHRRRPACGHALLAEDPASVSDAIVDVAMKVACG